MEARVVFIDINNSFIDINKSFTDIYGQPFSHLILIYWYQ